MMSQKITMLATDTFQGSILVTELLTYPDNYPGELLEYIDATFAKLQVLWVNTGSTVKEFNSYKSAWKDKIKILLEYCQTQRLEYRKQLRARQQPPIPQELIFKLLELYQAIWQFQQEAGLGIILEKKMSERQKMAAAAGIPQKIKDRMKENAQQYINSGK